jgi:hypothetical protein
VTALGANEVAEGIVRMAASEAMAARSEELAAAGVVLAAQGIEEITAAEVAHVVGREMAVEGIAEMTAGAAMLSQEETVSA